MERLLFAAGRRLLRSVLLVVHVVVVVWGVLVVLGGVPVGSGVGGGGRGLPVDPGGAAGTLSPVVGPGAGARAGPDAAAEQPEWVWPTGVAVVLRPWEAPEGEYGPGHRGIDVPATTGTAARAVADGTVAFAGSVGGRPVLTVDHGGGLVSTLDSVDPAVRAGDVVEQGQVVGTVVEGHCSAGDPCLHLGARVDGRYVDPMPLLTAPEWPVLLPMP